MALVEIKSVTKRYHKGDETITPLDGVSLNIEQGEFLSLMGASGTGKSTLLNLIASIDKPDSGGPARRACYRVHIRDAARKMPSDHIPKSWGAAICCRKSP